MRWLYLVLGIGILAIVVIDILWTTLWVDGGSGPLSGRLTTGVWRILRAVGRRGSRTLGIAGPLILTLTLAMWIALLWLGWTVLFASSQGALVGTHTGEPADWVGRLYYVAYTMFTNGNGDYTPTSSAWEIASSLTTATGMAFVTLGISYVLTVLGAVSEKRSFASDVTGLGTNSEAFVRSGWDGQSFEGIERPLESMATQLSHLAEQHEAYPILHYYHSEQADRASAMAVPVLDEALTLYLHGVSDHERPDPTHLLLARSSADSYLETLESAFIEPADEAPPPPNLEALRDAGIDTVSDDAFEDALEEHADRRRRLLGVVRADAWHWPPRER
ncbi:potassium channel family protein [Natronosalvus vescus]|uniref:potassium channel family protein n=1 Tax=Natronosalvus vescus TaxID=2953881 RepID=UPI002090B6CD|nr:potassium channel family protein [Natronosalvus vescus]